MPSKPCVRCSAAACRSVAVRARPLLPLAAALLAGCSGGILDPQGPVGRAERTILLDSLAIMLAIVVPTILATLAFAWWYRAGNARARYRPDWAFSGRIEIVVWAIPALTIILLGGVTWIASYRLDPAAPLEKAPGQASTGDPLDVQVVSLDWKWLFVYPKEGVASVNELVVPAGVPLRFSLTSASVMNTFFVPQLGSMIYTMNGMQTQLHLQADRPGRYAGLSGHFSGDGFSDMAFTVRALPAEDYAAWVRQAQARGGTLDAAAYATLARQGSPLPPTTWGAVQPRLFDDLVAQRIAPAPGPPTSREGAAERPAPTSTARPRDNPSRP
jgi:cytochrome o ubiquinol oxidase subunit 2